MARTRSWWMSWLLCGGSLGLFLPILLLLALNHHASEIWQIYEPQAVPASVAAIVVGWFLASRRPGNGLGWFFLVAALLGQISDLSAMYAVYGLETRPDLPGAAFSLYLSLWLAAAMLIAFPTVPLLLFPDGRLAGRWSRIVAAGVALSILILVGGLIAGEVIPPGFPSIFERTHHPFNSGPPPWDPVLGILLGGVCGLVSVGMLLNRFRLARGTARQQYKWVIVVMVLLLLAYVADFVARAFSFGGYAITNSAFTILTALIPISMAVAILRYRLWDIDLLISRALVYGALSASVVGIYIVVVGWLGTVFRTGGNLGFSLLATGVVAVLFQPLRDRIQRWVNRFLYGERDEPYAVISRLGRRLEDTFVPDAVLSAIVGTVSEALRLPYAAIALSQGGEMAVAAAVGVPDDDPVRLPLVYQQSPVGELHVGRRAPGEQFGPADLRLLDDLSRQAGIAIHSLTLASELQQARERLVTTREEERRRLRRDLHDGLGSQLAALHLHAGALRHLIDAEPNRARQELDAMRSELREAIASIRVLVHGLRPVAIDELGLLTALRERVLRLNTGELSMRIDFPAELPPLAAAVEVAVYRIVEEALANVVSHSGASRCVVSIHSNDMLSVTIEDNGVGIAANHVSGVGMLSIRERAEELGGRCAIETPEGGGTRVNVRLPLGKQQPHE
ncbi:MAG: histidine kinase [Thermomicrobiales bacterium]